MTVHDDLTQAFDAIVHETYRHNEPGAAVIVVKEGKVIYRNGVGMANLELGVSIEPDMVFRLGSVTKQFTGVAILMLMEEGRLNLEDPITRFLPDYPTQGHTITIRHLLTHTSGIKNYTDMPEWRALWGKDLSLQEIIDLFKDQPMDFVPGESWSYNNSGYVLLGAIIEKASGQTYEQCLQSHIFDPLGMKQTCYDHSEKIIPRRASGYTAVEGGFINATYLSMTHPRAAGALASSVDELAKWDAALYTEKLLKQSTLQQAFVPYQLHDGTSTDYGFGWAIKTHEGHRMIEHGGGINGFRSHAVRMPDDHVFVAMLTNLESHDPMLPVLKLAAAAIGKPYTVPARFEITSDELLRFVGVYEYDASAKVNVTCEGQCLFAQFNNEPRFELIPISTSQFMLEHQRLTRITFIDDGEREVGAFEIQGRYGIPHRCKRVDSTADTSL